MDAAIVYILLTTEPWMDYARRFVSTYRQFPGGCEHTLIVVCNDRKPDDCIRELFKDVPCIFVEGTNEGWDVGAWQTAAETLDCDLQVCFGSSVYFKRPGWLTRIGQAWMRHGPGFYGASASFEVRPHFQTTAFWCPPDVIRGYHTRVTTYAQRYEFEHGERSLFAMVGDLGYPRVIVNWDGDYEYPWRHAPLCSFKGDQSNMLMFWNQQDGYEAAPAECKRRWEDRVNQA